MLIEAAIGDAYGVGFEYRPKPFVEQNNDVDTIATIALGAASLSSEIENNLPKWMYDELENGTYGHDYLIKIDEMLQAKFVRSE